MAQRQVEVVLMRELASYLAVPIFLVDPDGNLVYYNEPAERLLGYRFEETGEVPLELWARVFVPTDADGRPLDPSDLPLVGAVRDNRPGHAVFWIRGLDGVSRQIEVVAMPLEGMSGRRLGAAAMFWEKPSA